MSNLIEWGIQIQAQRAHTTANFKTRRLSFK